MHKYLLLLLTILPFYVAAQHHNKGFRYRNYDSVYVVFVEQIDSLMLQKQLEGRLSKMKKQFAKTNRHLGGDSIKQIIDDTFYYYVPCFEICEETKDTVALRPYRKHLVKFVKLLYHDLSIGIYGDLGNCSMNTKYGGSLRFEEIDAPALKYSYRDVACSQSKLDYYSLFFAQNVFAIKDYAEEDNNFDFYWFSVDEKNMLIKYDNKDLW